MNKEDKKTLQMPAGTANSSARSSDQWANYWRDVKKISVQMSKEDRKSYDKRRNAAITRQRQIARLHELMTKYPDEVRYTLGTADRPTQSPRDYYNTSS